MNSKNAKVQHLIGLIWERLYPYIFAAAVTAISVKKRLNYIDDASMNDAANAVLTVTSIIVGFIGAILPVILGMKNESAFVKYVFSMDREKLFSKYIKEVLGIGLLLISVSIEIMFKDSFSGTWLNDHIFYIWIFLTVAFLLGTYRSVSIMLRLAFSADKNIPGPLKPSGEEKSEKQIQMEKRYSRKHD